MKPNRLKLLENQQRSYCNGTVEIINNEWVFFDNETDEAFPLENFLFKEVYIKRTNSWKKGVLIKDYIIQGEQWEYQLTNNDQIKIRKMLPMSFDIFLKELHDEAFLQFVTTLNSLHFSVYDCIYCHNFMSFLVSKNRHGVNFLIFDNGEEICSVHHHFNYDKNKEDRFEFTLSTGKRIVLHGIHPPSKA